MLRCFCCLTCCGALAGTAFFVMPSSSEDAHHAGASLPADCEGLDPIEFRRNGADETRTISAIDPNGIFHSSGLAIGDSLLAINGKKMDEVPSDQFRAFIVESFLTPEPPIFTVIRDGQMLDIPVLLACAPGAKLCDFCGKVNCPGSRTQEEQR